jgi:hypothetical protein
MWYWVSYRITFHITGEKASIAPVLHWLLGLKASSSRSGVPRSWFTAEMIITAPCHPEKCLHEHRGILKLNPISGWLTCTRRYFKRHAR